MPKHPRTKPKLEQIEKAENNEDWDSLIENAARNVKIIEIES